MQGPYNIKVEQGSVMLNFFVVICRDFVDSVVYLLIWFSETSLAPKDISTMASSKLQQTLQRRHNERDDVSNYRRLDCLFNRLLRRRSKKTSKLRVTGLSVGVIHRWPVDSPHKWPVTRKCFHLLTSAWNKTKRKLNERLWGCIVYAFLHTRLHAQLWHTVKSLI